MSNTEMIFFYIVILNIAACASFGIDKKRARFGGWRIPEKTLFLLAVFGGSVGAWLGMYLFHHKTRKKKFVWGIPVIFLCQCAVFWGISK